MRRPRERPPAGYTVCEIDGRYFGARVIYGSNGQPTGAVIIGKGYLRNYRAVHDCYKDKEQRT